MSNLHLLLAEEDEHTRTFLADNLTADGYDVDVVKDRDQAVARLRATAPDVIVVDVNGTTLALLDWLRGADSALCAAATDTPVIVLTSRSEEVHWVRLLERGGDDVIVKPFSYPELRARIGAVLRRTMPRQPRTVLTAGPVRVDLRSRRVTVDERTVELSAVEYRLLCHLAAEPSRVLTKINFELPRPNGGARSQGFRGSGDGLVIPFPPERLCRLTTALCSGARFWRIRGPGHAWRDTCIVGIAVLNANAVDGLALVPQRQRRRHQTGRWFRSAQDRH